MTISAAVTDPDRKVIVRSYGKTMAVAVNAAIKDATILSSAQHPDLYIRDVLGGLRAEVIWRDGTTTTRRTS